MLDSEQISFFKANGYLLVPGIMDKQLCSELQDRMWESLPENLDRPQLAQLEVLGSPGPVLARMRRFSTTADPPAVLLLSRLIRLQKLGIAS